VGDSKKAAKEVKQKLEATLTLGDIGLLPATPQAVLCGDYAEQWLAHYVAVACKPSSARIIHDLRHSYATIRFYEHHAPIQYASEQLGHASIKITVDTYGHPRQGTSIALADRLDTPAPETRP
jgi:integrase